MKKNKTNRYGKSVGLAVICGQVFREKPKKYKAEPKQTACGKELNETIGTRNGAK